MLYPKMNRSEDNFDLNCLNRGRASLKIKKKQQWRNFNISTTRSHLTIELSARNTKNIENESAKHK